MEINQLLKSIRQYFWSKNFTEVEIPYLNESLPLEPNIYAFKTTWIHKNQNYFLQRQSNRVGHAFLFLEG